MSDKKSAILNVAKGLTENYASEELFMPKSGRRLPNRSVIIDIVRDLKSIVFPGYFSTDTSATVFPEYYVGHRLNDIYDRLKNQIEIALLYHGEEPEEAATHADRTTCGFFEQLPEIQRLLLTDVQAGFDGDPAAKSKEEIIFSYPGLFAIYVYRLAHVLYKEEIPFIPRVMSEYAHGRTGIDINPGATIGEYFFIDHGTGVVVGETTTYGYEHILRAMNLVNKGAKLIATNTDITGPIEGGIAPACRAFVAPIEATTGKQAYYVGKPNPLMMRTGLRILGVHSNEAVMIGDRMDTDVIAGIETGLDTVLVLSGVSTRETVDKFPYRPRLILNGVGDIPVLEK